MQRIDRSSRAFVYAAVKATVQGEPYNPTSDVVEFAFPAVSGRPTTWYPGAWDGTSPISGSTAYRAQVLIGPGSTGPVLAEGMYAVFVRITDNPEVPVIPIGQLSVT